MVTLENSHLFLFRRAICNNHLSRGLIITILAYGCVNTININLGSLGVYNFSKFSAKNNDNDLLFLPVSLQHFLFASNQDKINVLTPNQFNIRTQM